MSIVGLPPQPQTYRVIAYVDGFNLYFGLRDAALRRYLWLDLPKLVHRLLRPNQTLEKTKYFTSLINSPESKRLRQATYIDALASHCGETLDIYYGKYEAQARTCRQCAASVMVPGEKKTDVNIAVEIMVDAFQNRFDTAVLVTADSDLIPPVRAIKQLFPEKRVVVAFPPERYSLELATEAHVCFRVGRANFSASQLPETIQKTNGAVLVRPTKWTKEYEEQAAGQGRGRRS